MVYSAAETKLPDTVKAVLYTHTLHPRILLQISKSSRATINGSSEFTTCKSDRIYACASFGSCRDIGTNIFKSRVSRLDVVIVFDKQRANTYIT